MSNEPYRPDRSPVKKSENPFAAGLEIKGNMPPELMQKINSFSEESSESVEQPTVEVVEYKQKPMKNKKQNSSFSPLSVSNKLQSMLEEIKEISANYEEIILPSLGKFYNGTNGPTDGKLHIRPMTGAEEQILATQRFVKKGVAMNMIFDKCIKESKQYPSENLLVADRNFLLIYLRGISYGPEYDVEITCPFTDKKFNYTIDLNLDIKQCPEDFNPSNLNGILPRTKYQFSYRLPNGSDEQKIVDHRDRNTKFDNANKADDTLLYRTALLINEIDEISDEKEILVLLKNLPIADVAYLRNITTNEPFGVNTKILITSPFTGEEFETELPFDTNFFLPTAKKDLTQA
jgi:hypothetical protein